MNLLLANTRLEASLPVNLVMLGRDGRPRSKNLKQIVEEWTAFRFDTVTRRTQHRLGEVDRRIHILDGRQIALLSIDKVIRIIRKADDPKADLMAEFGLTEIQADDILEIRLRQLARLEGIRIEDELKALKTERKDLTRILGEPQARCPNLVVSRDRGGCEAVRRRASHADRSGRAGRGRAASCPTSRSRSRSRATAGSARARATASTRRSSRTRPATVRSRCSRRARCNPIVVLDTARPRLHDSRVRHSGRARRRRAR